MEGANLAELSVLLGFVLSTDASQRNAAEERMAAFFQLPNLPPLPLSILSTAAQPQYEDYLVHALRSYRTGARKNAIMSGQIGNLTEQDFRDLAAFYARQKGSLTSVRQ
jgi:hypothetical protein